MTTDKISKEEEPIVEVTQEVSPEDKHVASLMSHTIDVSALATAVTKQKAADAADTLEDLDDVEAAEVIELMEENVDFVLRTEYDRTGKYGRVIGVIIFPDGVVLNDLLVSEGHAVVVNYK